MKSTLLAALKRIKPAPEAHAHCDGPCGVYDPAQARVTAEAVMTLTKKILELKAPEEMDDAKLADYHNTMVRYVAIKEQQAEETKHHLLVLWTDFFKPEHLEKFPDLHETFWMAAKACSTAKQEVSVEHAQELLDAVEKIHKMFWEAKGREVEWVPAVQ